MMREDPDPSLLLAALLREELWEKFWARQDNLFVEPLVIDDPEGNVWSVNDLEVPGDGSLRVVTRTGGEQVMFVVRIERED